MSPSRRPHLCVVGAGIAGLAASYEAVSAGAEVTVVDSALRAGGKIETSPLAGIQLDAGPDAFLARVPHATELCCELGLGDSLVAPAARKAYLWARGELRPFPERLLLGVPTDLAAVERSQVLTREGLARAAEDLHRPADGPPPGTDEAVGDLVRRRLGDEAFETLVDPLLSGVFAGEADRLSLLAGAPQIAAAARSGPSLIAGARAQLGAATVDPEAPVFLTLVGGLGRLVEALVAAIGPQRIHLGTAARALRQLDDGRYQLSLGRSAGDPPADLAVDGVVLTAPAWVSAGLISGLAPKAAELLAGIEYASVTLVSLAYHPDAVDRPLDGSGFLVPRNAGQLMTACSWASSKFGHLGGDGVVRLRVSAGRWGDERAERMNEQELLAALRHDLSVTMGIYAEPTEVRVNRWPRSLAQYTVGHLERVAEIEADTLEGGPALAVTGAAFRGVGLPMGIHQGRSAARAVLARLG
jgi:oxygen-dependent protoporphyrinogen oxidase